MNLAKTISVIFFLGVSVCVAQTDFIDLPEPNKSDGMPLMEALNNRQSNRNFSGKKLSKQTLSNILWAAFGINRPESGKRTAPSAMNRQEIDVYAALEKGLYLYKPKQHGLEKVKDADIRKFTGTQGYINDAPLNLVYVADTNKQSSEFYYAADTGFIGQNVYLYCASKGLNTVIRGAIDKSKLHEKMGLDDNQKVSLAQTVGHPK